jgi:hypothetical protein
MSSNPTEKINKICSIENCGRPLRARGFCVTCYYRNLRSGNIIAGTQTDKSKHRLTNINAQKRIATCLVCGDVKIRDRGNGTWRCSIQANKRSKQYKEAYRASKKAMLIDHCEICNSKNDLCWDHCHNSGHFRGTLCNNCNAGLGFFKDDTTLLNKAIQYLKEKKNVTS